MNLTEMEWNVMEMLWKEGTVTGRQATELMEESQGWSRSTTLTHLRRMEAKGAVGSRTVDGLKTFEAVIPREEAVISETKDFLGRVYKGSLSLLVSSFTQKQSLNQEEIDQLYAILESIKKE